VELIINPAAGAVELIESAQGSGLPGPFKNILLVLTAEGLLRRRLAEDAKRLISGCTNPVYRQMFSRWSNRMPAGPKTTLGI
jgi:hypothetical protein